MNIRSKIRQLLPDQPCLLCNAPSADSPCCPACLQSLPWLPQEHCPICALPTPSGSICGRCLSHPPAYQQTAALFSYAFPVDQLILALKFHDHLLVAPMLGKLLAGSVTERPDYIVPMPLHPDRLKSRGFNQSLLLAKQIARQLELPLIPDACTRIRNTVTQSDLPWKERSKNVRQAFSASPKVAGKHIAIVDDVMTTGATLHELAHTLQAAGASRVSAWVVARTLPATH